MTVDATDLATLRAALERFIGRRCWRVVAGPGTGSIVALDFGDRVPREPVLARPDLPLELRSLIGELQLLIYCAWRLEIDKVSVCGSADSNHLGGRMLSGLELLVGRAVVSAEIQSASHDLRIDLEGGNRLLVFCDLTEPETEDQNYIVFVPGRSYSVGGAGRIVAEPTATPEDA